MDVAGADRDLGMAFGSRGSNVAVQDKPANAICLRHTKLFSAEAHYRKIPVGAVQNVLIYAATVQKVA
jgi:hypothetical protein